MPALAVVLALVDLVLPRSCLGCGSPAGPLCRRCLAGPGLLAVPGGAVPTFAAAAYDGALRAALLAYKERGRRDLAGPLAAALVPAVRAAAEAAADAAAVRAAAEPASGAGAGRAGPGPPARSSSALPPVPSTVPVLVPVPSARAAAAARGGDHVRRLARRTGQAARLPVAPGVLRLARPVEDSAGLSGPQRAANLAGAMVAAPAAGAVAIVVDDIVTTGATLREATRALRAAGWQVGGAAAVAATPLTHPRGHSPRHPTGKAGESGAGRAGGPCVPLAAPRNQV